MKLDASISPTPTMLNANARTANNAIVADDTNDSISVINIAGTLLIMTVSTLAIALLSWFFKRYFCCWRKRRNSDNTQYDDENDPEIANMEEQWCETNNDNETTSTIPSAITISGRDSRWRSLESPKQERVPSIQRRFHRRNGRRSSRRRRRRRRLRNGRSSLAASPTTSRASANETNENNFFDHTTILTSSCDGMSLPDKDCHLAENPEKRSKHLRSSLYPPGAHQTETSYPNATIQFRNPINGESGRYFFEDGEIDLLVDFLVHTEDYVKYPRSKLTILLRATSSKTRKDQEELEHLRAIVADAAASRQQGLQVFITTTANSNISTDGDLLRCAPTGGILVTFESVWELPQDHLNFLKDLVV